MQDKEKGAKPAPDSSETVIRLFKQIEGTVNAILNDPQVPEAVKLVFTRQGIRWPQDQKQS